MQTKRAIASFWCTSRISRSGVSSREGLRSQRDRRCTSGKPFPRARWVGLRSGAPGVARLENVFPVHVVGQGSSLMSFMKSLSLISDGAFLFTRCFSATYRSPAPLQFPRNRTSRAG